ncbi:hypothetical protein V1478_015498 [Vespula squamosa]|uniref:Uncharacterized protein n=1 Tax=Vespula squamosa TaxID=30214 RepID=A0ABD2A5B6_VESSQ
MTTIETTIQCYHIASSMIALNKSIIDEVIEDSQSSNEVDHPSLPNNEFPTVVDILSFLLLASSSEIQAILFKADCEELKEPKLLAVSTSSGLSLSLNSAVIVFAISTALNTGQDFIGGDHIPAKSRGVVDQKFKRLLLQANSKLILSFSPCKNIASSTEHNVIASSQFPTASSSATPGALCISITLTLEENSFSAISLVTNTLMKLHNLSIVLSLTKEQGNDPKMNGIIMR